MEYKVKNTTNTVIYKYRNRIIKIEWVASW